MLEETFVDIPGYSRYQINKKGEVLNLVTGNLLSGSRNPAGYHNFRLLSDEGKVLTWGRHRLLCFVFKPLDGDIDTLVVNHLNRVPGSDTLDNLEWCTQKKNIEHSGSFGNHPKCTPVEIRESKTGKLHSFPSIIECARYLGYSKDTVNWRVKYGKEGQRIFNDGYQYRVRSNTQWPLAEKMSFGRAQGCLVKDLRTGEIYHFDRQKELAMFLGVKDSTVTTILINHSNVVLPGLYMVKRERDLNPWPDVEDPYLELCKSWFVKPVVKVKPDGSGVEIFDSPKECCKECNIKPTALNYRLKKSDKTVYWDGYCYLYYDKFLTVFNQSTVPVKTQ